MRVLQRDIYYGWVIVLALACTETISWGVLYYTFAVLMPSMEAELGWARGAHADDARVVPGDGTDVCLGAGCRSVHVLPDLGWAGPGDGGSAVRAIIRGGDGLVRPPAGPC